MLHVHNVHSGTGEPSNYQVNRNENEKASSFISDGHDAQHRLTRETTDTIISASDYSIRSRRSYIRPYYRSRLVAKTEIEKPWTKERRSVWPTVIPCFGFVCGLALIAVMIWLGVRSVPKHEYCLIMEDDFDGPTLNTSIWQYEIQLGGFGLVNLFFDKILD